MIRSDSLRYKCHITLIHPLQVYQGCMTSVISFVYYRSALITVVSISSNKDLKMLY